MSFHGAIRYKESLLPSLRLSLVCADSGGGPFATLCPVMLLSDGQLHSHSSPPTPQKAVPAVPFSRISLSAIFMSVLEIVVTTSSPVN